MRKKTIITVAASALVLAATGTALASIPDSNGVFHACYTPTSNGGPATVKVINTALSGGHCLSGQKSMKWNQTGPQGPQGPAGPTGATGPQGPAGPSTAGPAGLDVVVVTVQDQSGGEALAVCPADHPYVIGGGGSVAAELVSSAPSASSPPPPHDNAWFVESSFGATGQGNPGAQAEAICAK
jgi:hypothetical protein